MSKDYNFKEIEPKWQSFWLEQKTFKATSIDPTRPKFYALDMFPYPSGAGLHIGHPEGYTATDILSRYKQSMGYNVLHPMGWDAFGLPAEQHALATGIHPEINTAQNIRIFKKQLQSLGFAIDWDREISSTDPTFYKWTQWIFLKLFQKGLAYVDEKPVWWCPALGTALANEEVIDGRSERGNHPVERKNLRQWVLRITHYAEKLLSGLDGLDWPESTKRQQIAWIGRSEGVEVKFNIEGIPHTIEAFTTRIDTIWGVTFIAIAPEHPLVEVITTQAQRSSIQAYINQAASKSDLIRTELDKDKTGVFTGSYAKNPINQELIPIWVADYVLPSYGTGAVIGVPGHDQRDFDFAKKYGLKIIKVIAPHSATIDINQEPFEEEGKLINSGNYNQLDNQLAKSSITQDLEKIGHCERKTQYKLRDWLFSRQRYWGEPFPIFWISKDDFRSLKKLPASPFNEFLAEEPVTYKKGENIWCAVPLPTQSLPLLLPEVETYKPSGTGESPLANAKEWSHISVNLSTGHIHSTHALAEEQPQVFVKAYRETNTMPQWAGSNWYYLRFLDPFNDETLISKEIESYWGMPDIYIGGAEHAVLHLLYARFWHKVLYEIGVVSTPEPFQKVIHQGLILGEVEFTVFENEAKEYVSSEYVSYINTDERNGTTVTGKKIKDSHVLKQGNYFVLKENPSIRVDAKAHKMSKSRGNVVSPDIIIDSHGSDALRLYEMFLGPLEAAKPWNTNGIEGISRFLKKIWREYVSPENTLPEKIHLGIETQQTQKILQETIKKVTEDIEGLKLNTAISQMMIFINHIQKSDTVSKNTLLVFLQLLAPFAPHIAEELWSRLGQPASISNAKWPTYNPEILTEETQKIIIQINGKMRGQIETIKNIDTQAIIQKVLENKSIQSFIANKKIIKEIYVPGKILNLVVSD